MGDQTQPPGPYDPAEDDLARARRNLARVTRGDLAITTLGQLAGRLDVIDLFPDPFQVIREMRAVVAAYDERRKAVES